MKENQLKKLQMSAHKQINLEVKESAEPIVHNLAKQKVLSLNDFIALQKSTDNAKLFSSASGLLLEFVTEDCEKSILYLWQ